MGGAGGGTDIIGRVFCEDIGMRVAASRWRLLHLGALLEDRPRFVINILLDPFDIRIHLTVELCAFSWGSLA